MRRTKVIIVDFIFDTKTGHFLFVCGFTAVIAGVIGLFVSLNWVFVMATACTVAAVAAITDRNDKWI